ncbi:hypothetical protein TSST111916_18950 [Tsukamurella strandjordii]|uniref:hypothetical protein n=1 Tax=Tsukamurella TaxID=2060 RepID=UPI001C7DB7B6|nr:hypothetical protein [Tsukamurella sp. TY48]GIZ97537.1 hypothetical protein TTY48_21490 [Tsukamurella sp. TY48]
MIDDPAELYDGVVNLLDGVTQVRRQLAVLRHRYGALDVDRLGVDELGPAVSVPSLLTGVHRGLECVDEALRTVDDAVHRAMGHTTRLRTNGDRQ